LYPEIEEGAAVKEQTVDHPRGKADQKQAHQNPAYRLACLKSLLVATESGEIDCRMGTPCMIAAEEQGYACYRDQETSAGRKPTGWGIAAQKADAGRHRQADLCERQEDRLDRMGDHEARRSRKIDGPRQQDRAHEQESREHDEPDNEGTFRFQNFGGSDDFRGKHKGGKGR
jgi:hypothetical protein